MALRYERVHPVIGILISQNVCTVSDLKQYLTMEQALKMLDIVVVNNYNEKLANKLARGN